MTGGGVSLGPGGRELAVLLGLPTTVSGEEIRRAFREELKRLHPDGGDVRAPEDVERLDRLLAARDHWQEETDGRVRMDAPGCGVGWFQPAPRGPEPRPGFWKRGPR